MSKGRLLSLVALYNEGLQSAKLEAMHYGITSDADDGSGKHLHYKHILIF